MKPQAFDYASFRAYLKIWRNLHDLTLKDFAEMLGIGQSSLAFYEGGDRIPDIPTFIIMCNVMEVEARSFIVPKERLDR